MSDIFITHCKHGLDLRTNPRCYLCKPLGAAENPPSMPVGCLCPPFWWGIMPPPCPLHNPTPATRLAPNTTPRLDNW